VFLAAFVLGPPIGGVINMALLQVVPWLGNGLADPVPQFGANLVKSLLLALPLSYLVGGPAAAIAGLALAAYFAWGGRITWWACLAASLIYPAVLAANSMVQAITHSESVTRAVPTYGLFIATPSVCSALVCYFLLRNTKLVQSSGN
jgi:hypothetical protein